MSEWSAEHDECLEASKSIFNEQDLDNCDHEALIEVRTDATNYGLREVLMQKGNPVWYVSTCLSESKRIGVRLIVSYWR